MSSTLRFLFSTFGFLSSNLKFFVFSYKRRWGRSTEVTKNDDLTETLLQTSLVDTNDCAKKLVCSLNAHDFTTLAADEKSIVTLFGQSDKIDVSAVTAEFDLAALMGRQAGPEQCQRIYAR